MARDPARGGARAAGPWLALIAAEDRDALRRRAAVASARLRGADPRGAVPPAGAGSVRLAVRGRTAGELSVELAAVAHDATTQCHVGAAGPPPRLAFLFSGQSEVRAGMGAGLYRRSRAFADVVDRCDAATLAAHGGSLAGCLYGDADPRLLDDARLAQPALLALQCGLLALWRRIGVSPHAVAGHSLGEYAAACAAGAMRLDEAIGLVVARGALTQERARPGGAMAVVLAELDAVRPQLRPEDGVDVAGVNAPGAVVVSGQAEAVDRVVARCEAQGIGSVPLRTTHAFHSADVDPLLDALEDAAGRVPARAPAIPFASTLEGGLLPPGRALDAHYWRRHARDPVRFLDAMRALGELGCDRFLELGPQATLTQLGARCLPDADARWLASLRRNRADVDAVLDAAAALWSGGVEVDPAGLEEQLGVRVLDARADALTGAPAPPPP